MAEEEDASHSKRMDLVQKDDEVEEKEEHQSILCKEKRKGKLDPLDMSASNSRRKRRTSQQAEGATTTIDDLPHSIILSILSLLPTKEAVATSILSRSWRHLWTFLPSLHLDFNWVNNIECPRNKGLTWCEIVNHILESHQAPIERFWITDVSVCLPPDIKRIFYHLEAKSVKELRFSSATIEYFPRVFFQLSSLTSLYLQHCIIVLSPEFKGLENLKELNLKELEFHGCDFLRLAGGSKILESLTIDGCDELVLSSRFGGFRKLRKLTLKEMKFSETVFRLLVGGSESLDSLVIYRCNGFHHLDIRCNSLKSLEICGDEFVQADLRHATQLARFSLTIFEGDCCGEDGCLLMKMLKGLAHLKKVDLSFGSLLACPYVDPGLHTERFRFALRDLVFLDIQMEIMNKFSTYLICRLFESVPNLQTLIIQLEILTDEYSVNYWHMGMPFSFQTQNLQNVIIKAFDGSFHLDLATFFLRYSKVLKQMIVHFQSSMPEDTMEVFRQGLHSTAEAERSAVRLEFRVS